MSIADPRDEQQSHSLTASLTSEGCAIVKSDNLTSVEIVGTGLAHSPARSIIPLEAARHYSRFGWPVLPQIPATKRPFVTWREHQSHRGCFSPDQIDEWWQTQFPEAGIFLMPGAGSGIGVVDCDGEPAYHELCRHLNRIPNTPTVKSGNPDPYRKHFLFSIPPDLSTSPKITPWHPQLEFRGDRGLVVLPPSVHQSGNRYAWLPGRSIDEVALEPLPDSIVSEWKKHQSRQTKNHPMLTSPPIREQSSQQLNGMISDGHQLPMYSVMNLPGLSRTSKEFLLGVYSDGPRWNDRLFRAACDLIGNGVPIELATPLLIHGAKPWTDEDHQQAMATIESAYTVPRVSGEIRAMQYELKRFHRKQKRRK